MKTFINVLGELEGEGDEWIILLSHFDTKPGIHRDFQGANDSGSSTGLLLEMAAIIKKTGHRRCNFLFGFMDGEECLLAYSDRDGFHGSKRLARQMKEKNTNIKAVILMDMVGDRDLETHHSKELIQRAQAAGAALCRNNRPPRKNRTAQLQHL